MVVFGHLSTLMAHWIEWPWWYETHEFVVDLPNLSKLIKNVQPAKHILRNFIELCSQAANICARNANEEKRNVVNNSKLNFERFSSRCFPQCWAKNRSLPGGGIFHEQTLSDIYLSHWNTFRFVTIFWKPNDRISVNSKSGSNCSAELRCDLFTGRIQNIFSTGVKPTKK